MAAASRAFPRHLSCTDQTAFRVVGASHRVLRVAQAESLFSRVCRLARSLKCREKKPLFPCCTTVEPYAHTESAERTRHYFLCSLTQVATSEDVMRRWSCPGRPLSVDRLHEYRLTSTDSSCVHAQFNATLASSPPRRRQPRRSMSTGD